MFKFIKECKEPLDVPNGFTDDEYYEFYTRTQNSYDALSPYNATCPGTNQVEVISAEIILNLV